MVAWRLMYHVGLVVVVVVPCVTAAQEEASAAQRISSSHGKRQAWEALFQLEYDMVLAILIMSVVALVWIRALYLHWTVQPVKDVYKPKYQ